MNNNQVLKMVRKERFSILQTHTIPPSLNIN